MKYTFLIVCVLLIGTALPVHATSTTTSMSTEARVREYFSDAPAMIEIARCESKFRQFNDSGSVLRGGMNGQMIGVFQFYEAIHSAAARALGLDLTTLEGNLAYARHVYMTQGTTPWASVSHCFETATPPTRAQLLEKISELTALIAELQKQLEQRNKK